MVALAYGVVFDSINGPVDYNPFLSPDYRNQTWAEYPYGVTETDYLISTVTRINEIEVDSELKTGILQGIYFDDYYYRIHTKPQTIALGNLVSARTETVKVWNSYLEPKLLQSIDGLDDGITVTSPEPEPSYFAATEEREYLFNVAKSGTSIIEITAEFNFVSANDPTVYITGRRLLIIPYKPLANVSEKIEWLTDIIQSYSAEQRLAIRTAGRQAFDYEYYLTEQNFSKLKAIAYNWGFNVYAIPVWHEETKSIGTVSSGATQILFDTSYADYRDDSLIAVIAADNDIEAVEIDEVLSDRVTLKLPFPRTMTNVSVAPVRFARNLDGVNFNRVGPNHTFGSMNFVVTDNIDLSDAGLFDQYRSIDVLTDCIVLIAAINERIVRAVDVFDNGSAQVETDNQIGYTGQTYTMTLVSYNPAELWRNRQFLHRMKGRRGIFWRPTFNRDLILAATIGASSSTMTVQTIGYPLYFTTTDFMVEMKDGTRYYNRATSGTTSGSNDILAIESTFGVEILPVNVKRISFLHLTRIDSDLIEIRHLANNVCQTVTTIREVPA